jgi:hypothetical protein
MEFKDKRDFEIEKRVYQIRKRGKSWEEVSMKVSDEFDKKVTTEECKNFYNTHIARAEVISRTLADDRKAALKVKFNWEERMDEKLAEIDKWVHKLMNRMGEIFDKALDEENYLLQVKMVPTLLAICREILNQISVMKKQQEKIVLNQKNVILNEMQVLQLVNKEFKRKETESGVTIHPGTGRLIDLNKMEKKGKKKALEMVA